MQNTITPCDATLLGCENMRPSNQREPTILLASLVRLDPHPKACYAAGRNSSLATTRRVWRALRPGSKSGDWTSHTLQQAKVSVAISPPCSLVITLLILFAGSPCRQIYLLPKQTVWAKALNSNRSG